MTAAQSQVIYKSLAQVLRVLIPKQEVPAVKGVLRLCVESGLIPEKALSSKELELGKSVGLAGGGGRHDRRGYPFIVIEGLDGTGKTTLAHFLADRLQMKFMNTPPKNYKRFIENRDYFEGQEEPFKRAWYSLGNYLVANELLQSEQPVVMDRFWHSTVAYSMAHLTKSGQFNEDSVKFEWPEDLVQPDLVIFLQVSEKERLRRHGTRKAFTNTEEEQILADDDTFRQNVLRYYRSVVGPPVEELLIDGEQADSEAKILHTVLNTFPSLNRVAQNTSN